MARLRIKRPVALVYIVTEELKKDLADEIQDAIRQLDMRIQQIDFQTRRYILEVQKTDIRRAMGLKEQVEAEKQKHEDAKQELQERLHTIQGLELGSEFTRGTLESECEVTEGDSLADRLTEAAIVVKDGVVVEIRGGEDDGDAQEPVPVERRRRSGGAAARSKGDAERPAADQSPGTPGES